jgi:hypothetical protein
MATTYANTVSDGAYKYQDCLVLHPSLLVAGRVLLYMTPGGPVILGNTYQRVGRRPRTRTRRVVGRRTRRGRHHRPWWRHGRRWGTDPDPGTLPWARTYPDGTAYPTIDGGGTDTPANLSLLSAAVSGGVYTYTGSTITSAVSVDFTGKTDITIRGITMGLGGS